MENTCIIACETLKPELTLVMAARGCGHPVLWVPSGKHVWPEKLHVSVQETIDQVPASCHTILLVFGFCGNSMVGVGSEKQRLVLPRAADCIPIFLGSLAKRAEYGTSTYFFTEGYLHSETSFVSECSLYMKKYGEKRGLSLIRKMLGHYKRIAVIDTGAFDVPPVLDELDPFSKIVDIPVSVISGNLRIIDALLSGGWNREEFLVIPAGGRVSFEDSLHLGEAQ
ncbi:MAG: DUF1638 domain-containing protein [Clostridiales Family XIII bacterium]|jgi:hypothetical protein|nr:DUF1638 domain-containing protein [Clostridiales Family XIII bacterium]